MMLLVQDGKLRLDDTLAAWIPWLRRDSGIGQATLRQVLSHGAGIIRDGVDSDYWALDHPFPDVAALKELVKARAAILPINDRFKYSNIGYALLGLVIEAASGLPYNDFVVERIVQPLGLLNTGPDLNDSALTSLATGYSSNRGDTERTPLAHVSTGALSPATGFYSTPRDLCTYASAHFLGSDVLLSDATKRDMQHPIWKVAGDDDQYGLGFYIAEVAGRRHIGHSGGFPGFVTSTRIDPVSRLVVVALTNCNDGGAEELTAGMFSIIQRALGAKRRQAGKIDKTRFAGRFSGLFQVRDVVCFGADLVALSPEESDPNSRMTGLHAIGTDRLRITSAGGYESMGEEVTYRFGPGGQAHSIRWAGSTLRRTAD